MRRVRYLRSFKAKALVSAVVILAVALGASVTATTTLSTYSIHARLRESLRIRARYAADYLDVIMEEAVSQIEMVAEDAYAIGLAAQLDAEADPFRRSRIADELSAYLSLRYLGLAQPAILVIVGNGYRMGIASPRAAASTYRSIRSLTAVEESPGSPRPPGDAIVRALSLASGSDAAMPSVQTRTLAIRLGNDVSLGALVDLGLVLEDFGEPAAIVADEGGVVYGNGGWRGLRLASFEAGSDLPDVDLSRTSTGSDVALARARSTVADATVIVASDLTAISQSIRRVVGTIALLAVGSLAVWAVVLAWQLSRLFAPLADLNSELAGVEYPDRSASSQIMHRYRRRADLQRALRWWYLSVLIPVGICMAASTGAFSRVIRDHDLETAEAGLVAHARQLEHAVESLRWQAAILALDPELQAVLGEAAGYASFTPPQSLSWVLLRKASLVPGVSHVTVYGRAGARVYPPGPLRLHSDTMMTDVLDLDRMTRSAGVTWFLEPEGAGVALAVRIRGLPNPLHTVPFLNHLGFLVIRSRTLFDRVAPAVASGGVAAIVDSRTGTVRRLSGDLDARLVSELTANSVSVSSGSGVSRLAASLPYLIWQSRIPDTDWSLVHVVDRSRMAGPLQVLPSASVIFGVVLLLLFLVADLATARLLRPVEALHSWMETAMLEDSGRSGPVAVDNEFVHLVAGLEQMLARLRDMAAEVRRREVAQVELERSRNELQLVALQTQMNPHFLYNLFASVNLLIDMRRNDEAAAMLDATATLFRRGMYRGELFVPLAEELEHARAYLAIQQIRHRGSIEVVWSADESLRGEPVPKFILQPLVENSIEHGMKDRDRLTVEIGVTNKDGRLILQVVDDGSGITETRLATLRGNIAAPPPGTMEALANIAARLRLEYGDGGDVSIENSGVHGCIATVAIPLTRPVVGT